MAKRRLSRAYVPTPDPTVIAALAERGDDAAVKKYKEYVKENKRELARLGRELYGIAVPGDYDRGGY